jgi:hypothetical protein
VVNITAIHQVIGRAVRQARRASGCSTRAAFRRALRRLVAVDPGLARDYMRWLERVPAAQQLAQ